MRWLARLICPVHLRMTNSLLACMLQLGKMRNRSSSLLVGGGGAIHGPHAKTLYRSGVMTIRFDSTHFIARCLTESILLSPSNALSTFASFFLFRSAICLTWFVILTTAIPVAISHGVLFYPRQGGYYTACLFLHNEGYSLVAFHVSRFTHTH